MQMPFPTRSLPSRPEASPPAPDAAAAADIAACRGLLRHGSRSFFAASLLLPRSLRDPASALYAFCRLADDAVDLEGGSADAVADLRDRLARAYAGTPRALPADRALAAVVARFDVPRALPEGLIEGFEWDARGRSYETLDELQDYAARVAGTVGAMMAVLMGVRSTEGVARACDLGVAMQLSNIARDVGEDARMGRLYLPRQWLREAGIDPDAWLAEPRFTPALGAVMHRLLDAAEALYRRVDAGVAQLPMSCRPGINAARFLYRDIGLEVARRGLDSVAARATVAPSRKAWLLLQAVLRLWPSRAASPPPPLDATRFLVEAVVPRDVAAASASRVATSPTGGVEARVVWLIDLFERLERREQLQYGQSSCGPAPH
jgi:phytoene synthase